MNFSLPTKQQIVHSVERVLAVFFVGAGIVLQQTKDPFNKATWLAAGMAGLMAVWQVIVSFATKQ